MKKHAQKFTSVIFVVATLTVFVGCGSDTIQTADEFTNAQELASIQGTLASTCNLETVGNTDTCMSPADWKTQVSAICSSAGGSLGVVGYADDCSNGRWRRAKFQCCGAQEPVAPTASCGTAVIGSDDVCMTTADWNNALQNKCANNGGNLTDVSFGEACDGGHKFATFSCCPASTDIVTNTPTNTEVQEVTSDAVCEMQLLGTGNTCQTPGYWEAEGMAACTGTGHAASEITLGAGCGNDTYSFATITCCPDVQENIQTPTTVEETSPQKPELAPHCIQEVVKAQCMLAADWKTHVDKMCDGMGGTVTSLGVSEQCGVGTWNKAEFTCCDVKTPTSQTTEPETTEPKTTANETTEPSDSAVATNEGHAIPSIVLPEPAQICDSHAFGTSGTCQSDDDWRYTATKFCSKSGATPAEMTLHGDCKGGSQFARVTCCQAATQCVEVPSTNAKCISLKHAAAAASEACEAAGGKMSNFRATATCGKDGVSRYAFSCCGE
jgi:hypothetical protein